MEEFYEYLEVLFLLSPLLFFIVAVAFRLLDNSAFLFLQKEILIKSSYVSVEILREQMKVTNDLKFQKAIKRVLVYRKMHRLFILLMLITIPISLFSYLYLY